MRNVLWAICLATCWPAAAETLPQYFARLGHEHHSGDSHLTAVHLGLGRRGGFYYPTLSLADAEDPVRYRERELTTLRLGAGFAPSWTLAPFVEVDVDVVDALGSFGGDDKEASSLDRSWTLGVRWRVDERWSVVAYHRGYHVDDTARSSDVGAPFVARYVGIAIQRAQ